MFFGAVALVAPVRKERPDFQVEAVELDLGVVAGVKRPKLGEQFAGQALGLIPRQRAGEIICAMGQASAEMTRHGHASQAKREQGAVLLPGYRSVHPMRPAQQVRHAQRQHRRSKAGPLVIDRPAIPPTVEQEPAQDARQGRRPRADVDHPPDALAQAWPLVAERHQFHERRYDDQTNGEMHDQRMKPA